MRFDDMVNRETLVTAPVTVNHWVNQLEELIEDHLAETRSVKAAEILRRWDEELANFVQVCPKEMLAHLPAPLSAEDDTLTA